jgi:hypothetical protein
MLCAVLLDPVVVLHPKGRGRAPARAHGGREPIDSQRPALFKWEMTALPKLVFGGPPGRMEILHMTDSRTMFDLLRRHAGPGDIVLTRQGPEAALLTAMTGCWTTSGMLREARPAQRVAGPSDARFMLTREREFERVESPFGAPPRFHGPPRGSPRPPPGFIEVERAGGWTVFANPDAPPRNATPAAAVLGLVPLAVLFALAFAVIALDVRGALARAAAGAGVGPRALVPALVLAVSCLCLAPLAVGAARELRDPPARAPDRAPPQLGLDTDPPVRDLHMAFRMLTHTARRMLREGRDPDVFLTRERAERIRDLLQDGRTGQAGTLIRQAHESMIAAGISPAGPGPGRPEPGTTHQTRIREP